MAKARLDKERAARVLADAYFFGRPQACEKHGVALRTLEGYVTISKNDDELAVLVRQYQDEIAHREWSDQLSETLTSALRRIGLELGAVKVEGLDDLAKLMGLTKELLELEMSRMYAEADTKHDDSDAYAEQGQGAGRTAPGASTAAVTN